MSLERVANWLIVLTCVVALPLGAFRVYETWFSPRVPSRAPVGYVKGDKFEAFRRIPFGEAKRALVAVVSSTCTYCTQSMPFYRRLVEADRNVRDVQMVMAAHEEVSSLRTYINAHQVADVEVVSLGKDKVRITGTPTILLLSRDGTVEATWQGMLKPSDEALVLGLFGQTTDSGKPAE